jgi:hypothetical protein
LSGKKEALQVGKDMGSVDMTLLLLATERTDLGADVSEIQRQIDALVYTLYGLTDEEIAIVEGG